ncbi:nuclear transport factor 2 family protein [Dyella humicola]|uniref:nuclear transport factor 2 family protein n=1 Tax=Dyella humicola TaxID=2992126 RepID=UPI0022515116
MTSYEEKLALARGFHAALVKRDWAAIRNLLADDATWVLPGENRISAPAEGADAVVERAQLIASFGLNFELKHILVSRHNVALSLHNTADREGLRLDEYLSTVFFLKGDKIGAIETYLSDLPGMNAFFAH